MKRVAIAIFAACMAAQATAAGQIPVTCRITGEGDTALPYATAYCVANSNCIAANERGELTIEVDSRADTILFTMLGYVPKKLTVGEIAAASGTILLEPQIYGIEEVVVTPREAYNSLVNGRNSNVYMTGSAGKILLVKVLSREDVGRSLSAIVARTEKVFWARYDTQYMLRARVYSIGEDGLPAGDLLLETVRVEPNRRSRELRVDISASDIKLPAGGVLVGFEWLPLENTRTKDGKPIAPVIASTKMVDEELTVTGSMDGEWEYFSMKDVPAIFGRHPRNAMIGVEFTE